MPPAIRNRAPSALIDLIDYHLWPLVHLIEYAPKIFTDDAQHDDYQTQQESNERHYRGKPRHGYIAEKRIDDHRHTICKAQCGHDDTKRRYEPDRGHRKTQHHVQECLEFL